MVTITALCRATFMQLQEIVIPYEAANLQLQVLLSTGMFLVLIKKSQRLIFLFPPLLKTTVVKTCIT